MFNYLSGIMLEVLKFFYAIGGQNYGWSIIWLTIAVNMALYPLTLSSVKQMSALQKVQPKVKKLQEDLKDDPKKLQQEIMGIYKSEKVNPLGGCLPVLLKIPFFLALFFALQSPEFKELIANAGSSAAFLWVPDLALPDPLRILPLLVGATTYLMQKSMPSAGEQAKMMTWIMPIFIVVFSVNFPAGVQLYWLMSNLMGALQQMYIMRASTGSKPVKF